MTKAQANQAPQQQQRLQYLGQHQVRAVIATQSVTLPLGLRISAAPLTTPRRTVRMTRHQAHHQLPGTKVVSHSPFHGGQIHVIAPGAPRTLQLTRSSTLSPPRHVGVASPKNPRASTASSTLCLLPPDARPRTATSLRTIRTRIYAMTLNAQMPAMPCLSIITRV
jgi:hypothetical protein